MKVLCIGKSNFDITVETDEAPVFGGKYKYIEKNRCGGGPAGNVAYMLAKWGVETAISSLVGADTYAENIKKEFGEVGVNTNNLETNFEHSTSLSLIMLNKDGSKIVSEVGGEYKPLKKYNYESTPEYIFSDGYDYGATQNAVNKYTSVNNFLDCREVTNETMELSKYMKNLIASEDFAVAVSGIKIDYKSPQSLVNMYTKFMNKYPNSNVLVTLGSHGALYKENNQIKIMPGLKMEVKDTTGSKDAFIAAYIYSIINGFDIEKSITLANIAGGLVAAEIGGRNSIPALSTVLDEYNKKKGVAPAQATENTIQEPAPATEVATAEAPKEENQPVEEPKETSAPAEEVKEEQKSADPKIEQTEAAPKAEDKKEESSGEAPKEENKAEEVSIEVAVSEDTKEQK